jgi:hypothetical protein
MVVEYRNGLERVYDDSANSAAVQGSIPASSGTVDSATAEEAFWIILYKTCYTLKNDTQ